MEIANTRIYVQKKYSLYLSGSGASSAIYKANLLSRPLCSHMTRPLSPFILKLNTENTFLWLKKNIWTYFQVSKTKQEDFLERRNIKGWLALVNVRQCWTICRALAGDGPVGEQLLTQVWHVDRERNNFRFDFNKLFFKIEFCVQDTLSISA